MTKKKWIIGNESEDKFFYLSTTDENGEFIMYVSDLFKLSEGEIINLIKICLINARDKGIGRKILAVYRDSTIHKKHITEARLKTIGIENEEKPTPTKLGKQPNFR